MLHKYNSKWYKCPYRVIGVSLVGVLLLSLIGHGLTYSIVQNQNSKTRNMVSDILMNASSEKFLVPDFIVIVPKDSLIQAKDVRDSLNSAIINYVARKYTIEDRQSSGIDFSPYILNSEVRSEGKILKHIEFLNSTVTKAIDNSQDVIDTEISKLNTWVTVWIGVIGFLGIFFPLIINIRSLDELKELRSTLSSSSQQVEVIDRQISSHEKALGGLTSKTQNIENLVKALKLISKLKDVDEKFMIYNREPAKYISRIFEELIGELRTMHLKDNEVVIKDVLHQLSFLLYSLSTYSFVNKEVMKEMLDLSVIISTTDSELSEASYNSLLNQIRSVAELLRR